MRHLLVKTSSGGAFTGDLESENGQQVILRNVKIFELEMKGDECPGHRRFVCRADTVALSDVIGVWDKSSDVEIEVEMGEEGVLRQIK